MKFVRWTLLTLACAAGLVAIAAFGFLQFYLAPIAKDWIQKNAPEALGGPIEIRSASVSVLPFFNPSIGLSLKGVRFESPKLALRGEIERVKISTTANLRVLLDLGSSTQFRIELKTPKLTWLKPQAPHAAANPLAHAWMRLAPRSRDIGLELSATDGSFESPQFRLSEITGAFSVPSFKRRRSRFEIQSVLEVRSLKTPVDLAGSLTLENDKLSLTDGTGSLDGLNLEVGGFQNPESGAAEWSVQIQCDDLVRLTHAPHLLPKGDWSGAISADARFISSEGSKWISTGKVVIKDLHGNTEMESQGRSLKGQVKIGADFDFEFKATPEFRSPRFEGSVDLTDAAIEIKDLFKKPAGIPFVARLKGTGTEEALTLSEAHVGFASLAADVLGHLAWEEGGHSSLSLEIPKTDLSGWEEFFPMFRGAPIHGTVEVSAHAQGDWAKPESLSIQLKPLRFERVTGNVHWRSVDGRRSFSGPATFDAAVLLDSDGLDVRTAHMKLLADLTPLSLDIKDVFTKRAGAPLLATLEADQRGKQIELRQASLQAHSIQILGKGRITHLQRPDLDLRLDFPAVNLGEVARLIPRLAPTGLSGLARGQARLKGTFDFKQGFEKSPLRLQGDLTAQIPSLKIEPVQARSTTEPASPLLPPWPIFEMAKLKTEWLFGRLQYGPATLESAHLALDLSDAAFKATGEIGRLWGGALKIKRAQIKATLPDADLDTDLQASDLDLSQLAGTFSKSWGENVRGRLKGHGRVFIPNLARRDFKDVFQAHGTVHIKEAALGPGSWDQLVFDALAQSPAKVDANPDHSKPPVDESTSTDVSADVTADVTADVKVERQVFHLGHLKYRDSRKDELLLDGTIGFDQALALSGVAHLTGHQKKTPLLPARLKAHTDSSGRLQIPLKLSGSVINPKPESELESVRSTDDQK